MFSGDQETSVTSINVQTMSLDVKLRVACGEILVTACTDPACVPDTCPESRFTPRQFSTLGPSELPKDDPPHASDVLHKVVSRYKAVS